MISAAFILVAQAAAMHMLSIKERQVPAPPLQEFPSQMGDWQMASEDPLDPGVLEYLKPDSYILRNYGKQADNSSINLFVAYFSSLQSHYGPHSPSVCLPGSGWLVLSSRIRTLNVPGRAEGIPVNEYVLEKSNQRILVFYWYQNDRNVWAEEFWSKFRLLPDLIRYKRSDVSLIRLVTAIQAEDLNHAEVDCQRFTQLMFPHLVSAFKIAD